MLLLLFLYKKNMRKRADIIGKTFHYLKVLRYDGRTKNKHLIVECACKCGKIFKTTSNSVLTGNTKSCGCWNDECRKMEKNLKHGFAKKKKVERLYRIWLNMKTRSCNNTDKKNKSYINYAMRGISICDEWKNSFDSFKDWAIQNGYSNNLTIDRIDNNGNYEPSNCRWVSLLTQANNRRSNHYIEYNGEKKSAMEWSRKYNIPYYLFKSRIDRGWDFEKCIKQ